MVNKIFAPFAVMHEDRSIDIDLNSFISRILLFDHYTIDSMLMRDIAKLTNNIGVGGLTDLIRSGIVSIHTEALSLGQIEEFNPVTNSRRPTNYAHKFIPLNHYDPVIVDIPDRKEYIGHGLKNIDELRLPLKQKILLKNAIVDNIAPLFPTQTEMVDWTRSSVLSNNEVFKTAIINSIKARQNKSIAKKDISIHVETYELSGYHAISNIRSLIDVDEYEEHKIIEKSILDTSGFYKRLSLMKSYDSIAWFSDDDSNLLNSEIKHVATEIDSRLQERRLTRILELKGLPLIDNRQSIDINSLMKLRDSNECRQFREWLKTMDAKSDKDILSEVTSYKNAFNNILTSDSSRIARFMISTVVGSIHPVAGVALGVADQFILDRLIKRNGPISFINNSLPRLSE